MSRSSRCLGQRFPSAVLTCIFVAWLSALATASASASEPLRANFLFRSPDVDARCDASPQEKVFFEKGGGYGQRERTELRYGFTDGAGKPRAVFERVHGVVDSETNETRYGYNFSGDEHWRLTAKPDSYAVRASLHSSAVEDAVTTAASPLTVNGVSLVRSKSDEGHVAYARVDASGDGELRMSAPAGTQLRDVHVESQSGGCTPFPSNFDGKRISNLQCSAVKVGAPFAADLLSDQAIASSSETKSAFTMVMPSSVVSSYESSADISPLLGTFIFTPGTQGSWEGGDNDVTNAVGVGLDVPDKQLHVQTSLLVPEKSADGTKHRGCLYAGLSDRDYVAVCVEVDGDGARAVSVVEGDDVVLKKLDTDASLDELRKINLNLKLYPLTNTVSTSFSIGDDGSEQTQLQLHTVNALLFSKDAAATDFTVETGTFGGVYFSGASESKYVLMSFSVAEIDSSQEDESGSEDFDYDWTLDYLHYPTIARVCQDGLLYVGTAEGLIGVFNFDRNTRERISLDTSDSLGQVLITGIECDPDATPGDMAIYVSHTDYSQQSAAANSGGVSRVSGPNLSSAQTLVWGLPRSYTNHATYNIHFGEDGLLYIGQGSNSAAGAPNTRPSDFSVRPEQPLSAALLRVDIKKPGLRGDCTPTQSPAEMESSGIADPAKPDCDVEVYAAGLRSSYDCAEFNGRRYCTDNGVGGMGTFPLLPDGYQPGDDCVGVISEAEYDAHDAGIRYDNLVVVEEGRFYGHPNPTRKQCIFHGGNPTSNEDFVIQRSGLFGGGTIATEMTKYPVGTKPDPLYAEPLMALGTSVSPDGIIAYQGGSFCGGMYGDLLVTYWSQMDQVRQIKLDSTGLSVVSDESLRRSTEDAGGITLRNPLGITQDKTGMIYVVEMFAGHVRVFDPIGPGCWQKTDLPTPPDGMDYPNYVRNVNELYVFGGQKSDGSVSSSLYVYNGVTNKWSTMSGSGGGAPPPTFNAATATGDDCIFVLGGFTAPDARTDAVLKYDPATGALSSVPTMKLPKPLSGASAFAIGETLVLMGGQSDDGVSAKVYSVQLDAGDGQVWAERAKMAHSRKNAAAVTTSTGQVILCGGVDDTDAVLDSCELFDNEKNQWSAKASMPGGRHSGQMVGTASGALLYFGGRDENNEVRPEIFEYDPTKDSWTDAPSPMPEGRAAAAAARFGTATFIFGGSSPTDSAKKSVMAYNYK